MIDQSAERDGSAVLAERVGPPKVVTLIALVLFHIGALLAFLPQFFSWSAIAVCLSLYFITGCIGITLGFHRMLTHRSLRMPRVLECIVATCGTLALQGGPIEWISTHRAHHKYSDTPMDPHDANRGFFWSHFGWLVLSNPARLTDEEERRFAHDFASDPFYRFLEIGMVPIQIALGIGLFLGGGWSWVIWGIFVRLVLVYHITWFVNSASHDMGYQTYESKDLSTNNWWVAFLAWGEGWHNNHHAFPFSARHGLKWYEFDFTWLMISTLARIGLVSDVKLPTESMLERRKKPSVVKASDVTKSMSRPVLDQT